MRFYTIRCAYSLHGSRRATECVCVAHPFHLHVIHDVCLNVRCPSSFCPSPVSLRRFYLFSSLSYLYSDQHFLSKVNSVEGINHCAFAQRGVLPHRDFPSSHTSLCRRGRPEDSHVEDTYNTRGVGQVGASAPMKDNYS